MGQVEPALNSIQKFLCVLAGSLSFFMVYVFILVFLDPSQADVVVLGFGGLRVGFFVLVPALIIAWIVSWRNQRHGPVRLFLTGIILPALVSVVLRVAWIPWFEFNSQFQNQSNQKQSQSQSQSEQKQ